MDSKYQNRRNFLKKSGLIFGLFGLISSFLKPGKYIFPKEVDSDSAFIPRDPQDKI